MLRTIGLICWTAGLLSPGGCNSETTQAALPTEDLGPTTDSGPTPVSDAETEDTKEPDPVETVTGLPPLPTLQYEFETVEIPAGAEYSGWCQSWVLNNPEEIWVNTVSLDTDGGYHHSNWFFVPEGKHDYPDGLWKKCYSTGFSEIEAALLGGVLFAQSTQVDGETQTFPPGAAIRIPPYSRIIGATHLLNAKTQPLTTGLRMTLQPVRKDDVITPLTPFRLSYLDLAIPKKTKVDFTGECLFKATYEAVAERPLDMRLFWVLPHYHALGSGFRLEIAGGPRDGELIFEIGAFSPEPFGKMFEEPLDLSDVEGFRFTCSFNNTLDKKVWWGIGDNEMCVMLGFADSALALDMSVLETKSTDDTGEVIQNTGPCTIIPVSYEQDKDGGIPPE